MVLLGEKDLPRRNGFAVRQIRFAWTEQANWIWNYFRSYLREIFIQFWTYIIQHSYHLLKKNQWTENMFFMQKNTTVYLEVHKKYI